MENKPEKEKGIIKEKIDVFLSGKSSIELQAEKLKKLFVNGNFDGDIIRAVSSLKVVITAMEDLSDEQIVKVLPYINPDEMINYINENGTDKYTNTIIEYVAKYSKTQGLVMFLNGIKSDRLRAELLIKRHNKEEAFLPFIEDPYLKNGVLRANVESNGIHRYNILEEIKAYEMHKEELNRIIGDNNKAKYIAKLEDNNMKIVFLSQINERSNRKEVIKSIRGMIDPRIQPLDNLVQKMIKEYFNDVHGNLSEDKQERLEIVLNSTNVSWEKFDSAITHGRTYMLSKSIGVSDQYANHLNDVIATMAHEYGHAFAEFDYAFTGIRAVNEIDEGMADLFSELVINHYLEKQGKLEVKGLPIRIEKPFNSHSAYNFEAAWPRTMLAGLESKGKDKEAIAEYFLGKRENFFQMALGKEGLEKDRYGMSLLGIKDWEEDSSKEIDYVKLYSDMYYSPELDFNNVNRDSFYYKRNFILPAYILQKKLGDKADIIGVLQEGKQYDVSYIANKLFGGKKFFEVPREELEEFIVLLDKQVWPKMRSPIINLDQYTKEEINRINPDDISAHSFEILNNAVALAGDKKICNGIFMEKVIDKATGKEITKIIKGQPTELTKKKKELIVKRYKKAFEDNNENMYILDNIKDFEFYCEQLTAKKSPEKSKDMDIE